MASHYTREADRVRLTKAAMHKLQDAEANFYSRTLVRSAGLLGKNTNENNAKYSKWWAWEDSNLEPSGYDLT